MYTLFKSCKSSRIQYRNSSTSHITEFALKGNEGRKGRLSKIYINHKNATNIPIQDIINSFIKDFPEHLFIFTTPTVRLQGEYGECIYPGHNFAFITNAHGVVSCCMSKRPNTRQILSERKRAPDERLNFRYSPMVKVYAARFTSVEEEVGIWAKRTVDCEDYPLYIHIIPFSKELGIDSNNFQRNVEDILLWNKPYVLHSSLHPMADHYIRAENCNNAVQEAIFGSCDSVIQDMSCQEAATNVMKSFVNNWSDYQQAANYLGLMHGIEKSPILADLYRVQFTC